MWGIASSLFVYEANNRLGRNTYYEKVTLKGGA